MNELINKIDSMAQSIQHLSPYAECGKVTHVTGMLIEIAGLSLAIGEICRIYTSRESYIEAEVIGLSKSGVLVMPYEHASGISRGMIATNHHKSGMALVGDALLGRVVDALGQPMDDKGHISLSTQYPLYPKPLNPLKRHRISNTIDVGVRTINALLTIGQGQRMGIFAESGIGKSVLIGMMTKFTEADVVVVGLVGERGREVKEFIEEILGDSGLKKTVIIAATADHSPLMKVTAAAYATSIAEYFRDAGKNVLLIIDSLTRFAQSHREMSCSVGELPTAKGYTPSVYAKLSQLIERSGYGTEGRGSITAFYTILIENEQLSDPIAEHVRSLIDGHIALSKELAESGHYPAIDIEKSISRLMNMITDKDQQAAALKLKKMIYLYQKNKDLVNMGMYSKGSDKELDSAIRCWNDIRGFLVQDKDQPSTLTDSKNALQSLLSLMRE